jgi:hypothetical protein
MVEIRGRLLIGGMVLRDLEGALSIEGLEHTAGWTGVLWVAAPGHESLQVNRPYRLELDDQRSAQVAVTAIEVVPGRTRRRVFIQGRSPLEASHAHDVRPAQTQREYALA